MGVENRFLEIAGLDSRSGLITGDSLANVRGLTAVVLAFQSCLGWLLGAQGENLTCG